MNRYELPNDYRAPRADRLMAMLILILFIGWFAFEAKAAPPMPNPGQPVKLNPADVLNPEFPAAPESDQSDPSDATLEDDAFARAAVVLAGEPAAAPEPEPEYEWYIPTWAKWLSGAVGTALAGWYAIEKVDLHEDDSAPAPPPVTPAAIAAAGDSLGVGGNATDADFIVTIVGDFIGSPQSVMCNGQAKTFVPALTFAQANPGAKGGRIDAYISSQQCTPNVPQGSSSWTPGSEGEIVILCPDPFYLGRASLQGGVLVLANGARLAGGEIRITPKASAP